MKKITPESSWMIGDYLHGYTVEHIANLYSVPQGTVEAIIAQGMTRRRSLKKQTKLYQPPKREPLAPKHIVPKEAPTRRKPTPVPITPTVEFRDHQIRAQQGMYCLSDLVKACGLHSGTIKFYVDVIDAKDRAKMRTRWEGGQPARAWFISIDGAITWAKRPFRGPQQKSRKALWAFIEQQTGKTEKQLCPAKPKKKPKLKDPFKKYTSDRGSVEFDGHTIHTADGMYQLRQVMLATGFNPKTVPTVVSRISQSQRKKYTTVSEVRLHWAWHVTLAGLGQWLEKMGKCTKQHKRQALKDFIKQEGGWL